MSWPLEGCTVAGATRPGLGRVAFARGAAVLARVPDDGRRFIVRSYPDRATADGEELSGPEWAALRDSGDALDLPAGGPPACAVAAVWVLRRGVPDWPVVERRLRECGALLSDPTRSTDGAAIAFVVDEPPAASLREQLAAEAFDLAWAGAASGGDLAGAVATAEYAFAAEPQYSVSRVALLAALLAEAGRQTESDGYLESAARGCGSDVGKEVRASFDWYREALRLARAERQEGPERAEGTGVAAPAAHRSGSSSGSPRSRRALRWRRS